MVLFLHLKNVTVRAFHHQSECTDTRKEKVQGIFFTVQILKEGLLVIIYLFAA